MRIQAIFKSVNEVAEILGVTAGRVRAMIAKGRLPATKFGGSWVIELRDLKRVRNRRPGRPSTITKEESQ